jgi:hypothetical protein
MAALVTQHLHKVVCVVSVHGGSCQLSIHISCQSGLIRERLLAEGTRVIALRVLLQAVFVHRVTTGQAHRLPDGGLHVRHTDRAVFLKTLSFTSVIPL